ncbi:MAG: hypothetical protein KJ000_09240 [Pirellulaceae bacterium]|nr:hypothetical protein [Pirellulaceae bacterium]
MSNLIDRAEKHSAQSRQDRNLARQVGILVQTGEEEGRRQRVAITGTQGVADGRSGGRARGTNGNGRVVDDDALFAGGAGGG